MKGTCTTEKNKKYIYKKEISLLNAGNPDGPTLDLANALNAVPEPVPAMQGEITTTTQVVAVPAGTKPNSSRMSMPSAGGSMGYTPDINNLQMHGTVVVSFSINKSGRAVDIRVRKPLNEDLDRLALKIATNGIRMKTDNQPSIIMGKPIETQYTLPITF